MSNESVLRAAFEAWRKTEAWATVADMSAEDEGDDGSFRRMMNMAAWSAFKAGREQGLSEVKRNAERYQWLRDFNVDSYLASGTRETLDAAIDDAMKGDA